MNRYVSVFMCLLLTFGSATADTVLDEDTVRGISEEFKQGVKDADIAVFKKYLYPGSEIVVDLDPSPGAGHTEVSYSDYINLMEMTLPMIQNAVLQDEVLSISIDDANNQATIKEKTFSTVEVMGVTIREVSISETTYGIVDGRIRVLVATSELLSSEAIE